MVEREMQELLWRYPDRLLNEPLKQVAWEESSSVGRADLVFEDRQQRLLIVEVKRGKLPRGAIDQLLDYFGMIKQRFPDRPVEMMVVANLIPSERRIACESRDIECREISEKRFREIAAEVGYIFRSDLAPTPVNFNQIATPKSSRIRETKAEGKLSPTDRTAGDALYVVVRHRKDKDTWGNDWEDDCRLKSITTRKRLGDLCEAEKESGNVVYVYRCEFKAGRVPSVITCSTRVGEVEHDGEKVVVHFITEEVLGETGKGLPTTPEQRWAARQKKYYYAPPP